MSERGVLRSIDTPAGRRAYLPAIAWARLLFALSVLALALLLLPGCATETTRTITTDKAGTVTDVTVTKKGADPAALKLASVAAEIYLPRRAVVIREEKSAAAVTPADLRRLLRGPILPREIALRWRPAAP